jgi:MFS family permease
VRALRDIPPNVRAMGWASLVNDAASELLYPVLPLFLVGVLHAPAAAVGVTEAAADASSKLVGVVVGRRSDRIARRLPFVWAGYGLSNVAKPLIALAPAWGWVAGARVLDRAGKGIRTAPRDALLRDSSLPGRAGATFGYHRFMDSAGATAGPLIALALLELGLSLRAVIAAAIVPALITMLVLRRLREAPGSEQRVGVAAAPSLRGLPRPLLTFTGAWALFSLGNSADAFLLLRAHELGLGATAVVLAYVLYNAVYAGLSWPFGHLSDTVGRRRLLAGGLLVFAAVYAGFGLAESGAWVWPLMAAYGVYIAATDGVAKALVSDLTPIHARATGQAVFNLAGGAATVVASLAAGLLWSASGSGAVFALGAFAALAALVPLAASGYAGSTAGSASARSS